MDNHIIADVEWPTLGVEFGSMGDVKHSIVLNTGSGTYLYPVHITADNSAGPH